ncbi:helix-turn-helix domain-containing protein [Paracoccus bogoriensis]|uniref:helix-turn-helix transcriptional regulator n=1 Tax=Paracoccus bogoriensis TaxID=242065 RepID=UPI001C681F1F|nr:helix-turn-helix domain-containing protein [Paracoccus bogoriensis]MBW7057847.1 helix-turn-helix domain-containing protein [Paracoccus bogoriensis]
MTIDDIRAASPWLTTDEAAAFLKMKPKGLEYARATGRGPKFYRPSHKTVRYHINDLEDWLKRPAARG